MRQKVTLASSGPSQEELKQEQVGEDTKEKHMITCNPGHTLASADQNEDGKGMRYRDRMHTIETRNLPKQSQNSGLSVDCFAPDYNNCCTVESQECNCLHTPGNETERKSPNGSKINENSPGSRALRYALHLRFLCPSPKKSSRSVQRCKSDPTSVPEKVQLDAEGDRRFYLYNDLRVIFPQRHSDTDEGKVSESSLMLSFVFRTLHCM